MSYNVNISGQSDLNVNPTTAVPLSVLPRDPTTYDNKNFTVGWHWINTSNNNLWYLASLKYNPTTLLIVANWVLLSNAAGDVLQLTGNSGGAVFPLTGNINVVGTGVISVVGNPGTHTLTITPSGAIASSFITNPATGTATPASGVLTFAGAGSVVVSASGSTVTITGSDSGTVTSISAGTGITLTPNPIVSTGTVALTVPVIVANGGTGATTLTGVLIGNGTSAVTGNAITQHSLQVGGASNALTQLGVATNGQLPIGSTGADPVLATITAGSGISVTNGAGSIVIANTAGGSSAILAVPIITSSAGYTSGSTMYTGFFDPFFSTTLNQNQAITPRAGTIAKLYINVQTNTNSGSTAVTLNVNGSATALTVTVGAGATGVFSDTTHSVSISAGDLICMQVGAASGGGGLYGVPMSCTFT